MNKRIVNLLILLNFIRCFPHLIIYSIHPKRKVIRADIRQWLLTLKKTYNCTVGLVYLLLVYREYRNLFYYRIGAWKYFLNIICREVSSLYIDTKNIGEGLFINHGFSTVIGAKSIGKNCRINQQVTIGDYFGGKPVILDNVHIHSGAIIIGDIIVGNNSNIGANATVFRDVPDNCTVFPTQSRVMKWNEKIGPVIKKSRNE